MAVFTFAADIGKRLGLGRAKDADEAALAAELEALGLAADGLALAVDGARVQVTGTAADTAAKEKILLAVGNVEGVGEVEDGLSATDATPAAALHTVAPGETLWAIAEEHYGQGAQYTLIFEANRPMLEDPDRIFPGQVLRVPPLEEG